MSNEDKLPSLYELKAFVDQQREWREAAQARILEAQRTKEAAEAEARRAMLVEYHLYRAASLQEDAAKPDRFEEAYLRWQVGLTHSSLALDPLMFDTEKVYRLVKFLAAKHQLNGVSFDAATLRLEFPNWIDSLELIPTDGSIRSALKSLSLRRTGIREDVDDSGSYVYLPEEDASPRFRRKAKAGDQDPAAA